MTVLGNIVAVTSIVTVVSLIQGMNAMVSTPSSATSAPTRSPSSGGRRSAPRRTRSARATTRCSRWTRPTPSGAFSPHITAVMAQAQRRARCPTATRSSRASRSRASRSEYLELLDLRRRARPDDERRPRSSAAARWRSSAGTSPTSCSADVNPLDKVDQDRRACSSASSASARSKGAFFGNSQDDFAVIPLGAYMKLFGARQSLTLMVKPTSPGRAPAGDGRRHGGAARRAAPQADASRDNFGIFTSDTLLGIYQQATTGIFAVLVGVVALSLRRRRHRHHEHHADGGERAHARDRPAQGARRASAATSCRRC